MNTKGHSQKNGTHSDGFSIVEMALVLLAGGIVSLVAFTVLIQTTKLSSTEDRAGSILYGISEYVRIHGHYPCPASMSAAPEDQYYSVEARSGSAPYACDTSALNTAGPDVLSGAVPVRTLAAAADCSADPSALPGWENLNDFPAWIKDIQHKSLRFVRQYMSQRISPPGEDSFGDENHHLKAKSCPFDSYITDKYGDKFFYAVTTAATRLDTYNPLDASANRINIYDKNNTLVSRQTFVILSMGEDGKGAVKSGGGTPSIACGSTDLDSENCDGDANFRDMYNALGTEHFDDYIDYSLAGFLQEDNMWRWGAQYRIQHKNKIPEISTLTPKPGCFWAPMPG